MSATPNFQVAGVQGPTVLKKWYTGWTFHTTPGSRAEITGTAAADSIGPGYPVCYDRLAPIHGATGSGAPAGFISQLLEGMYDESTTEYGDAFLANVTKPTAIGTHEEDFCGVVISVNQLGSASVNAPHNAGGTWTADQVRAAGGVWVNVLIRGRGSARVTGDYTSLDPFADWLTLLGTDTDNLVGSASHATVYPPSEAVPDPMVVGKLLTPATTALTAELQDVFLFGNKYER